MSDLKMTSELIMNNDYSTNFTISPESIMCVKKTRSTTFAIYKGNSIPFVEQALLNRLPIGCVPLGIWNYDPTFGSMYISFINDGYIEIDIMHGNILITSADRNGVNAELAPAETYAIVKLTKNYY